MPSYTQYMRQMAVMDANDDDIESWITVKGNHIPIKKGQSKEEAVKSFIEKKGGSGEKKAEPKSNKQVFYKNISGKQIGSPKGRTFIENEIMTEKEMAKRGFDPTDKRFERKELGKNDHHFFFGARFENKKEEPKKDTEKKAEPKTLAEKKKDSVKDILMTYAQRMSNAGRDAPLSKTDRIEADAIKEFMKRKVGEGKKYNDYYEYWLNGMSEKDKKDFNQIYHESEAREMAFRELSGLPTYINYNESNIESAPKENEAEKKSPEYESFYNNGFPTTGFGDSLKQDISVVNSEKWNREGGGISFGKSTYGDTGTYSTLKISDRLYNWMKGDEDKIKNVAKHYKMPSKYDYAWEDINNLGRALKNARKVDGGYEIDVDTTTYSWFHD